MDTGCRQGAPVQSSATGARDLSHTKHYGLQRQPEEELQALGGDSLSRTKVLRNSDNTW